MSLIQELVFHTVKTVKSYKTLQSFEENLSILKDITNKLTVEYFCLEQDILKDKPSSNDSTAPFTYIDICHTDIFSIGVFVMKPGSRMPIHNHPNMHGILKVLQGSGISRSINVHKQPVPSSLTPLLQILNETFSEIDPHSEPIMLTPNNGNIHEIHSLAAPTAFLDILFPPYNGLERVCSYYKQVSFENSTEPLNTSALSYNSDILKTENETKSNMNRMEEGRVAVEDAEGMYLQEIAPPEDFWCETCTYKGPRVSEEIIESWMRKE